MYHYVRNLKSEEQVADFLKNIVEVDCSEQEFQKYVQLIYTYETGFRIAYNKQTLYDKTLRDPQYSDNLQRESLAKAILQDLLTLPILDNEIDISQGIGGCLPQNLKPREERQAYYIIGLPTSGKSCIANILSTIYSACVIDIDIAERKFPEYQKIYGPCVTHSEANRIVFGTGKKGFDNPVFNICINQGWNIVIPKIGNKIEIIINLAMKLRENNYTIHLLLTKIDRKTSVKRSFERFLSTQRYISLPMIFDWYANDPSLAYYELRNHNKLFFSYEAISFEEKPIIIDKSNNAPLQNIENLCVRR